MVDIARSPDVIRKKKIRRIIYGVIALLAIVVITVGVSRLKPAAPSVDRASQVYRPRECVPPPLDNDLRATTATRP